MPSEIAAMLRGEIFRGYSSKTIERPTQILLGQPTNYPVHITEALVQIFRGLPTVDATYLAHCAFAESTEPPHTMIGLAVRGEWEPVVGPVMQAIRRAARPDEIVDVIRVDDTDVSRYMSERHEAVLQAQEVRDLLTGFCAFRSNEMEGSARNPTMPTRRRLVPLLVVGVQLLTILVAGLVMRVGHVSPDNSVGWQAYNTAFTLHGAPVLPLLLGLLLVLRELARDPGHVAGTTAMVLRRYAWTTLCGAALLSLTAGVLATDDAVVTDPDSIFRGAWLLMSAFNLAASVLIAAYCAVCAAPRTRSMADITLATAGVAFLFGIGLLPLVGVTGSVPVAPSVLPDPLPGTRHLSSRAGDFLAVAGFSAILDGVGGRDARAATRWPIWALLVVIAAPRFHSLADLPIIVLGVGAAGRLAVQSIRHALVVWKERPGEALFIVLAAASFCEGLVANDFLRVLSTEVHLHDTYAVVAAFHLEAFTALYAIVALLHRHRGRGDTRARAVAVAGGVSALVGSHVFHGVLFGLGVRGMPRRYANYLPEFHVLHVVVTAGAFVLVGGLAAALIALVGGRESTTGDGTS